MNEVRINKYISDSGFCTRREADEYVESGRVTINGQIADFSFKVDPENDHVKIDGESLHFNPDALAIKKEMAQGWRAEKKAKKEAVLAEAAKNPKSRTLRSGRKANTHVSTKLDENGRPITGSRPKKSEKNGRMVTKGASMRMEDAIKNPTALSAARERKEAVNPKSNSFRSKGKQLAATKSRFKR